MPLTRKISLDVAHRGRTDHDEPTQCRCLALVSVSLGACYSRSFEGYIDSPIEASQL